MGRIIRSSRTLVNFCFDNFYDETPVPNCARWEAEPLTYEWREYSLHFPYSEPVHFLEYLAKENINHTVSSIYNAPAGSLYPVSISFFDFGIDWFHELSWLAKYKLKHGLIKLWFLYSEGDNPMRIRDHLSQQFAEHGISWNNVHFTSANTRAGELEHFSYFMDDELLYQLRNKSYPTEIHNNARAKKFTALVRTHKWWRATSMARLWRQDLHKDGFFSYYTSIDIGESESDNPIEHYTKFGPLLDDTHKFLQGCPYTADTLSQQQHNEYRTTVIDHHRDSYVNLVLETHLDVDQSKGVFLTEKTFKPIKHGQLFIILGAKGSLAELRNYGYRTFDHIIDNSYDDEEHITHRWDKAMTAFEKLVKSPDLHTLYQMCKEDLEHNQQLFLRGKADRLNRLLQKVCE